MDMLNTNSKIHVSSENKTKQDTLGVSNWASKILRTFWTAGEIFQALQCAFVQHTWRRVLRPQSFVAVDSQRHHWFGFGLELPQMHRFQAISSFAEFFVLLMSRLTSRLNEAKGTLPRHHLHRPSLCIQAQRSVQCHVQWSRCAGISSNLTFPGLFWDGLANLDYCMRTSSPSVRPAKNGSNSWEPGILRESLKVHKTNLWRTCALDWRKLRSQTRLHYIADRVLRSAYDMFHLPKEETRQKSSKSDSFRFVSLWRLKATSHW